MRQKSSGGGQKKEIDKEMRHRACDTDERLIKKNARGCRGLGQASGALSLSKVNHCGKAVGNIANVGWEHNVQGVTEA